MRQKPISLAEKAGCPAPFLKEIIEQEIEEREDSYFASEILQRVDKGQEKTYSTHEVRTAL